MKVTMSKDERYPVYCIAKLDNGIEVTDDLWERYERTMKDFDAIQAELRLIYEGLNGV